MFSTTTAVATALVYSLRFRSCLHIKPHEYCRYFLKSANLALCYRGFSPFKGVKIGREAGRAAFFCCAYDVLTDWRNYDKVAFLNFLNLVNHEVPPDLMKIVLGLFDQERKEALQFDGLSRGIIALEFVTKLMGLEDYVRRNLDLQNLGIVMQIVDDVLDLEHDRYNKETNCLVISVTSRAKHLHELICFDVRSFREIFPHAGILCRVVRMAQKKARKMLFAELEIVKFT